MRRLLCVVVAALAWSASAQAAAPTPDARAFYVVNGTTGEVLAAHAAYTAVPIASITKLMTVLVALDRLSPTDVVTVTGNAAQVGESRIPLPAAHRSPAQYPLPRAPIHI